MYRRRTLRWVNSRRSALGLPGLRRLPRGRQGDTHGLCPVSVAFSDAGRTVFSHPAHTVVLGGPVEVTMRHPRCVQEFIWEFDAGWHADLVGEGPDLSMIYRDDGRLFVPVEWAVERALEPVG